MKVKKIISFFVFIMLVTYIFTRLTYMYREVNDNRYRAAGIREDKYDIVYIGGSEVHTYWQPMRVWKDKGWTSMNYSSDGIPYEIVISMVQEAEQYQEPQLYIISLRNILNLEYERGEGFLRNVSDGMNVFSVNRFDAINNYLNTRNVDDIDELSLYIDIFKYHTKHSSALSIEESWRLSDNSQSLDYMKGYEWNDGWEYFDAPSNTYSEDKILSDTQHDVLCELLEYLKKNNINALFVVNPYYEEETPVAFFDEAGKLVEEYGYGCLNLNCYYEEMGWDFSKDLTDCYHANCFGAEKFTVYLENYIDETYDLSTHKEDSKYDKWNEDLAIFLEEEAEHKEIVRQIQEGIVIVDENTDNLP